LSLEAQGERGAERLAHPAIAAFMLRQARVLLRG
jgi:hypothetical protein